MLVHNGWETCPHQTTSIIRQPTKEKKREEEKENIFDSREYSCGKSNQVGKLCFSYDWCAT